MRDLEVLQRQGAKQEKQTDLQLVATPGMRQGIQKGKAVQQG
jgi:hypothetical protein